MRESTNEAVPHQTTLNDLLASEISAVEIYNQALDAVSQDPGVAGELRRLLADHERAVTQLRRFIRLKGEAPASDSGLWGLGAKVTQGIAKRLGTAMVLRALREGEIHSQWKYENLVRQVLEPETPSVVAFAARQGVVQQQHIDTLARLLEAAA